MNPFVSLVERTDFVYVYPVGCDKIIYAVDIGSRPVGESLICGGEVQFTNDYAYNIKITLSLILHTNLSRAGGRRIGVFNSSNITPDGHHMVPSKVWPVVIPARGYHIVQLRANASSTSSLWSSGDYVEVDVGRGGVWAQPV